jgi:hypothetical protein
MFAGLLLAKSAWIILFVLGMRIDSFSIFPSECEYGQGFVSVFPDMSGK